MRPELVQVLGAIKALKIAGVAKVSGHLGYARTWARPFVLALELAEMITELYPSNNAPAPRDKREALYSITELGLAELAQHEDAPARATVEGEQKS